VAASLAVADRVAAEAVVAVEVAAVEVAGAAELPLAVEAIPPMPVVVRVAVLELAQEEAVEEAARRS